MSIKYELIQVEQQYGTKNNIFIDRRTLFIIGRDENKNKQIFFINDFFPRFFVEKDENISLILESNKEKIKNIKEKNYKNLGGTKELIKIYTYKTSYVVDLRDYFGKTYEANIPFTEVFKRKKLIKGFFYVPMYVFSMKTRPITISNVKYIMLKQKEINGGELTF